MSVYAERLAAENGWEIIEISLRAVNAGKHRMFYEAGVEEFLSLVKYAQFIVTNSYHGMIFSIQFRKNFAVFSREQCDTKISELLSLLELSDRANTPSQVIDYDPIHIRLAELRMDSLSFLDDGLSTLGCL